jgi:hypothetical protein
MRRLARLILLATTLATAAASAWTLSQNPFTTPIVARSTQAAKSALDRALAGQVDSAWLISHVQTALDEEDLDALELYLDLAQDADISLPAELMVRASILIDAQSGVLSRARGCANCALDITSCQRLSDIAICAIPVEMTPIGDLNALRHAGVDWINRDQVDRLDVGLAVAGLGATGLAIGTGGTSLSLKAGASLLRLARKLDALTPKFSQSVLGLVDTAVDWPKVPEYLIGQVPLNQISDAEKLAELGGLARNLDLVRANTSTAEALVLMRYVDTRADAANLALLSTVQGTRTRHTLAALGKSRSFRLLHRLSDLAFIAIALLSALAMQILSLCGMLVRWIVSPLRRQLH